MLSLTIDGVNFTTKWRVYESRWTSRAHMGESFQSEFVIDDEDSTINHLNLASKKIVEVWEDASGSPVCMYRGRVANKTLGRGMNPHGVAMRWTVTAEDYNLDLRGLRVTDSTRPEESDRTRVLAYAAGYLNGAASTNPHARDSTELGTSHVINASLITLIEQTYTDTYPVDVFSSICEFSAKTFFVFVDDAGDGQLYYANLTDTSYLSDIEINDNGSADGQDVFSPYKTAPTGEHDGQRVVTGGGVRYGNDAFFEESDQAGGEAFHDKWEEHFTDEFITTEADADRFLLGTVTARSNEDFTYIATIDMQAEDAHRVKAGMIVPTRIASANLTTLTNQRAVQVTHEPQLLEDGAQPIYKVTIELGMPRTRPFQRNIRRKPGPFAPTPPSAGICTRLYPAIDGDSPTNGIAADAGWEHTSGDEPDLLFTTPQSTRNGGGSSTERNDTRFELFAWILDSVSAPIIAAGGASIRGQFRSRARSGIGISESAQDMYSLIGARVTQGASPTIRGTALALSVGSTKWAAQSTYVNRSFSGTLAGVSGAAVGDRLIIEVGYRNNTPSPTATGGGMWFRDSAAEDLPEDESTTENLNSWIEICTSSTPGDTTEPVGSPGSGTPGDSNVYSPIDHVHEHGTDDEGAQHEAVDVDYDATTSGIEAGNVQEAIDALAAEAAGAVVDHATLGASEEFDASEGGDHEGILDQNLTVTLTGATDGEAAWLTLALTDDGGGPSTITWPGSVVWPGGVAPTPPEASEALVVSLLSYDGGTTWYGSYPGAGSAVAALDDLTDVTITAAAEGDMLRFDGSEWVNTPGRWEPVTDNPGGGPELVWDGDEIVMTWSAT